MRRISQEVPRRAIGQEMAEQGIAEQKWRSSYRDRNIRCFLRRPASSERDLDVPTFMRRLKF